MADQIILRQGTAADWVAANPVLAAGEMGIESDTLKTKIGDGATAWNSLSYKIDYVAVATVNRPTGVAAGYPVFDTTLGQPIWYNGTAWVDATGVAV